MDGQYSIMWMDAILFIHPSIDGHLGYARPSAVVSSAAANVHVQVFLRSYDAISLGQFPGAELLGYVG